MVVGFEARALPSLSVLRGITSVTYTILLASTLVVIVPAISGVNCLVVGIYEYPPYWG